MRRPCFAQTAALVAAMLPALSASAATTEEKSVLGVVQQLLDGWRYADASMLENALHRDFREVTLHLQNGTWNSAVVDRATLIGLMARIEPPPLVRWGVVCALGLVLVSYLAGQLHLWLPDRVGLPAYGTLLVVSSAIIAWNWRAARRR